MRTLAVIPAKFISERVPGKNMRLLAGERLIDYTMDILRLSAFVDEIAVSSDSYKILEYAVSRGCTPICRPPELSVTDARSWDVIKHVWDFYKSMGVNPDYVIEAHATYPFRRRSTVVNALDLCTCKGYEGVLVAYPFSNRVWRLESDTAIRLASDIPVDFGGKQQPLYHDCYGLVNVYTRGLLSMDNPYDGDLGLYLSTYDLECFDINTETDFWVADKLMERRKGCHG